MDNVLAVALLDEIFMYRYASNETSKFEIDLKTFQDYDKITSLKWMPKDNKIAIGLDNNYLSVWDVNVNKLIYSIHDHSSRVASIGKHCRFINDTVALIFT
jgi:WD40 repeat protein